jgi:hypothetical protein
MAYETMKECNFTIRDSEMKIQPSTNGITFSRGSAVACVSQTTPF